METFYTYKQQENRYIFDHFYNSDGWRLGSYLSELAVQNRYSVAIEIEVNGSVIYRFMNDGASENNFFWIRKKKNVVNRFQMSSGALAAKLQEKGMKFTDCYGDERDYAVTPGAFPIRVKNVGMIGTVGISGLDSDSDHQLIIEGLEYLMSLQSDQ